MVQSILLSLLLVCIYNVHGSNTCCNPAAPLDTEKRCLGKVGGYDEVLAHARYKNYGSDTRTSNRFGQALSMNQNYLVVGSPNVDSNRGAVYVFRKGSRNRWEEIQKIEAPNGTLHFGESVSICDDESRFVVGDSRAHGNIGRVLVYELMQGVPSFKHTQTLTLSNGRTGTRFGNDVAIYKDTIVVGAFGKRDQENKITGAAYLFKNVAPNDEYTMHAELSKCVSHKAHFGTSVSIHRNAIVIGAPGYNSGQGIAFIYSTWSTKLRKTIKGSTPTSNLGATVRTFGRHVVVAESGLYNSSGAVRVYRYNNRMWDGPELLRSPDGDEFDVFGKSIAIKNRKLVVGAYYAGGEGACSGSAYFYEEMDCACKQFKFRSRLKKTDGEARDYFGISSAISWDTITIGASGDDDYGSHAGRIDTFSARDLVRLYPQRQLEEASCTKSQPDVEVDAEDDDSNMPPSVEDSPLPNK